MYLTAQPAIYLHNFRFWKPSAYEVNGIIYEEVKQLEYSYYLLVACNAARKGRCYVKVPLAGLVVAAGMSQRMGAFKPVLPLGDKTIIAHVVENLQLAGVKLIVVVTGKNAHLIHHALQGKNVLFVHNCKYMSTQMYDSVKLGLAHLQGRCDRFFFQPCDIPFIQQETFFALVTSGADVAHPAFRGRKGHPVLLDGELIPALLNYGGEGGLKGALASLSVRKAIIPVDDEGVLLDADFPADYELLQDKIQSSG